MKDKRVQKEANFFPLFHVKLVILHSALSCNRELDGGGRLNNPARFCPSRAKAHCSDGNENILEMKRTFSPSPRLNFLARLFISAISAPLRARSPSQAFIFTRCPFNAPFSSFFSPSRMRRGCDFITDPESDYHQGDPMRLNYKEVGQDKHCGLYGSRKVNWKRKTKKEKTPTIRNLQRPSEYHSNISDKLLLVANKQNEFKLSR